MQSASERTGRQKRHEATRASILAAALAIAREDGWLGVTMRRIAERIDYSHAALYAYFATKEVLLLALVQEGGEKFHAAMQAVAERDLPPAEKVAALGRTQWEFAWQHPELYQVMHGLGGVAFATEEARNLGKEAGSPAVAVIAEVLRGLGHDPQEAERKTALAWSTIHGLIALTMAGRFTREEGAALVAEAAQDAFLAWGAPAPEET